jgi:hypothetical protein
MAIRGKAHDLKLLEATRSDSVRACVCLNQHLLNTPQHVRMLTLHQLVRIFSLVACVWCFTGTGDFISRMLTSELHRTANTACCSTFDMPDVLREEYRPRVFGLEGDRVDGGSEDVHDGQ